ncbi:hypothetical protein LIA77_10983 [Sarocladium implicatum]|nr:hypothetical protein LIA77_10983 [Sarocladium implicatum]
MTSGGDLLRFTTSVGVSLRNLPAQNSESSLPNPPSYRFRHRYVSPTRKLMSRPRNVKPTGLKKRDLVPGRNPSTAMQISTEEAVLTLCIFPPLLTVCLCGFYVQASETRMFPLARGDRVGVRGFPMVSRYGVSREIFALKGTNALVNIISNCPHWPFFKAQRIHRPSSASMVRMPLQRVLLVPCSKHALPHTSTKSFIYIALEALLVAFRRAGKTFVHEPFSLLSSKDFS